MDARRRPVLNRAQPQAKRRGRRVRCIREGRTSAGREGPDNEKKETRSSFVARCCSLLLLQVNKSGGDSAPSTSPPWRQVGVEWETLPPCSWDPVTLSVPPGQPRAPHVGMAGRDTTYIPKWRGPSLRAWPGDLFLLNTVLIARPSRALAASAEDTELGVPQLRGTGLLRGRSLITVVLFGVDPGDFGYKPGT